MKKEKKDDCFLSKFPDRLQLWKKNTYSAKETSVWVTVQSIMWEK